MSAASSQGQGMLLVLSGPSGVGKDTVWKEAAPCLQSFARAVTCTTRARRPGEEEGVDYFFVSEERFDELLQQGALLEWARVHAHRVGVPASSVMAPLSRGQDVICIIDVQGACRIRELYADAFLVFLKPPPGRETAVLKSRIERRGAADESEVARRLQTAAWELEQTSLYDCEIVNEEVEQAARDLCAVVLEEKARRAQSQAQAAAKNTSA